MQLGKWHEACHKLKEDQSHLVYRMEGTFDCKVVLQLHVRARHR